jgi:hypothetical protein
MSNVSVNDLKIEYDKLIAIPCCSDMYKFTFILICIISLS